MRISDWSSDVCSSDLILPVVPLFHVNAWGLPYLMPLTGTKPVFPGPRLDGASLFALMDQEKVTAAWGVPTVWLGLVAEMRRQSREIGRAWSRGRGCQ